MPIFDPVLASPPQPRQLLDPPLGVPHLDPLSVQPRLDLLTDETARHRIGVPLDVDRAAGVHPHRPPLARLQAPRRQRSQLGQFLRQALLPGGIELREELTQKRLVGPAAVEVPAAAQQQRLFQSPLELAVALLDIPILVALARLDGLRLQTVVP